MKASIQLPNGSRVDIEGTEEEVKRLIDFYQGKGPEPTKPPLEPDDGTGSIGINIQELVNTIHSCEEAEVLEAQILDKGSRLDRILLVLWIANKYFNGNDITYLGASDISETLEKLAIKLAVPNIYKVLRNEGKKYVMRTDKTPATFGLNRRGIQYIDEKLQG